MPDQAQKRLEEMCVRAEKCTFEIREKLRQWRVHPDEAEAIVSRLVEKRFVDDARFARAYVHDKVVMGGRGRNYARRYLSARRIPDAVIDAALQQVDDTEYEVGLYALLLRKVRAVPALAATYESRTRLYRFALARGFEASLAVSVLKRLLADLRDSDPKK